MDVYTKHFTDNTSTFITDIYMNEIVPGSAEINPNHKYLDWITKNWSPSDVSEEGVMEHNLKEILLAVSKFDNQAQRLEIKDLNQYKDINHLFDALKKVGETARRGKLEKENNEVKQNVDEDEVCLPTKNHFVYSFFMGPLV